MTTTAQRGRSANINAEDVFELLEAVADPEIPVLSVIDLGIVRGVKVSEEGVEVSVAPTYTGCPATEVIEQLISSRLTESGIEHVTVRRVLSPPWTTDWLTESGKNKLRHYGIAPPVRRTAMRGSPEAGGPGSHILCPRCTTGRVTRVSEFGSTPCKASYKCDDCLEPFEYFKCI